jgi:hypothetical protein
MRGKMAASPPFSPSSHPCFDIISLVEPVETQISKLLQYHLILGKKKDGRRLLFYRQKYNPKKPTAKIRVSSLLLQAFLKKKLYKQ